MKCRRAAVGLLAIVLADAACFDSDQTVQQAVAATTTGGPTTGTTTTTDPTTGTTEGSTTGSDKTCRDAIECVFQCAALIQALLAQDPDYEPNLGCFLECEEELSVDEVYKLLQLANCTALVCKDMGVCDPPSSESSSGSESSSSSSSSSSSDSSSSGSSSSSESSSSSGSSSSSDDGGGLLDPCLECVFVQMLDPESPGCEEFAMQCQ